MKSFKSVTGGGRKKRTKIGDVNTRNLACLRIKITCVHETGKVNFEIYLHFEQHQLVAPAWNTKKISSFYCTYFCVMFSR